MEQEFSIFEDGHTEPKAEEKAALIAQLISGDFTLSFSSLSAFAISPRAFIAYKLQERKTTPAMILGELVHCMVLEPEKVPERYFIAPAVNGATKEGKATWQKIYADFVADVGPDFKMTQGEIIEAVKAATGTTVVSDKVYQDALFRARQISANAACRHVLNLVSETERRVEYEFEGLKFTGRIDGLGTRMLMDLKNVPDASLDRATGAIWSRRLHWQAFGYDRAMKGGNQYYVVCVDGTGETSVHAFNQRHLDNAEKQLVKYTWYFKQAIVESIFDPGVWDMSQDFWLRSDMNTAGVNYL